MTATPAWQDALKYLRSLQNDPISVSSSFSNQPAKKSALSIESDLHVSTFVQNWKYVISHTLNFDKRKQLLF